MKILLITNVQCPLLNLVTHLKLHTHKQGSARSSHPGVKATSKVMTLEQEQTVSFSIIKAEPYAFPDFLLQMVISQFLIFLHALS